MMLPMTVIYQQLPNAMGISIVREREEREGWRDRGRRRERKR